ncbi:hypothetical protein, partial [Bacteroides pyogenes]|uniref:hypothetical protein n=1 Tax=Bacteroides pyogenes TaxID=310300 RepID=UPI001CA35595
LCSLQYIIISATSSRVIISFIFGHKDTGRRDCRKYVVYRRLTKTSRRCKHDRHGCHAPLDSVINKISPLLQTAAAGVKFIFGRGAHQGIPAVCYIAVS